MLRDLSIPFSPSFLNIRIDYIHFIIANVRKMSHQRVYPEWNGAILIIAHMFVYCKYPFLQKKNWATHDGWPCCVGRLSVWFLGEFEAEADTINETGLLVQAAETAYGVDDFVFLFEGFAGHRLVEFIKRLFNLLSIIGADMFVIGIV